MLVATRGPRHRTWQKFTCAVELHDCQWATTAADTAAILRIGLGLVSRTPRAEGFRMLGAWITVDSCAYVAVRRGIRRAWAAWAKPKRC
eukprot:9484682-Pyramimonas_sp.AAC.1